MTERKGSPSFLLHRAFRDAGFSPQEIEAIGKGEKKEELREFRSLVFPKPPVEHGSIPAILVMKVEEIFTYGALEEIEEEGFGAVHPRLIRKFIENDIIFVGDLVSLNEHDARRVLGRPTSKTYRAVEAVLAKYHMRFGMELPDR